MSETLDQKPTIGPKEQIGLIGLLLSAPEKFSPLIFAQANKISKKIAKIADLEKFFFMFV